MPPTARSSRAIPEFTRAQGTTFLFSRCFTASKDRFGCTTCHDPHRSVDTACSHYEAKCLSCHSLPTASASPRRSSAAEHESAAARMARSCPVNPTGNCISCHMPKVEDPSRRSRFTDHHIRVHRGDGDGSCRQARPLNGPLRALPASPRLLPVPEGSAMIEK